MIELETDRLRLRQFTGDDLDDLARIFANPAVTRFIGVAGETASRKETELALDSMIAHWKKTGFGRWAVVHKEAGKLIGYGGLRSFGDTAELVYLLDQPYWGKGLATELALACLRFGFIRFPFEKIVGLTKPENLRSRRVLEKVGMHCDREVEFSKIMAEVGMEHLSKPNTQITVLQYSISRGEFGKRSPSRSVYTADCYK